MNVAELIGMSAAMIKIAQNPQVPGMPAQRPVSGFPQNVSPLRSPLDLLSWSEAMSGAIDRQQPGQPPPQLQSDPTIRNIYAAQSLQFDPRGVPGSSSQANALRRQMTSTQQTAQQLMTQTMNQSNQALRALRGADAVSRIAMPGLGMLNPGGVAANAAMGRPSYGLLSSPAQPRQPRPSQVPSSVTGRWLLGGN